MKVIYKITYPNGKIYVGSDLTNDICYFGSPNSKLIENDFTIEQKQKMIIVKEIIWKCETATDQEVRKKEKEFIILNKSNDLTIGYNQNPRLKGN